MEETLIGEGTNFYKENGALMDHVTENDLEVPSAVAEGGSTSDIAGNKDHVIDHTIAQANRPRQSSETTSSNSDKGLCHSSA